MILYSSINDKVVQLFILLCQDIYGDLKFLFKVNQDILKNLIANQIESKIGFVITALKNLKYFQFITRNLTMLMFKFKEFLMDIIY